MCCRRDKDGVGFKALLERYDRLKEENEKLSSKYESEKAANAALTYKYDSVSKFSILEDSLGLDMANPVVIIVKKETWKSARLRIRPSPPSWRS